MTEESADGAGASASSTIRHIPSADVHRITSGQVVLDLQTAVKELVENSLDALATNIEVRFKNYGAESIEVIDNGSGIEPKDYDSVALKHYTSKLSALADIAAVQTFGFRGEALSSLCALGHVTLHTATAREAPVGTLLELDSRGAVVSKDKKAARQRGTTVSVTGLFNNLPVRRREFEKNVKREFAKAQTMLQAYALISKGVRWSVSNIPKGGRKTIQLSVNSSANDDYLSANIAALFGSKMPASLSSLDLSLNFPTTSAAKGRALPRSEREGQDDEDDEDTHEQESDIDSSSSIRVRGLISRPTPGCGRSTSDRQFLYINGRPWEAPKVARAFNDVYRAFNTNQVPVVVADFQLPTDSYDVNVSPDKRTIFLHGEQKLLDALKAALDTFFAPSRSTFALDGASVSQRPQSTQSKLDFQPSARRGGIPSSDSLLDSLDEENEGDADSHKEQIQRAGADGSLDKADDSEHLEDGSAADSDDELQHLPDPAQRSRSPSALAPEHFERADAASSSDELDNEDSRAAGIVSPLSAGGDDDLTAALSRGAPRTAADHPASLSNLFGHSSQLKTTATQRGQPAPDFRELFAGMDQLKRKQSPREAVLERQPRKRRPDIARGEEGIREHAATIEMHTRRHMEYAEEDSEDTSLEKTNEKSGAEEQDDTMDTEPEPEPTVGTERHISRKPATETADDAVASLDDSHILGPLPQSAPELDAEEVAERKRTLAALDASSSGATLITQHGTHGPACERFHDIDAASGHGLRVPFSLPDLQQLCAARGVAVRAQPGLRVLSSHLPGASPRKGGGEPPSDDIGSSLAGAAGVAETDTEVVERTLSRVLHKHDFSQMDVLGQFNKGFIIARRRAAVGIPAEDDSRDEEGGTRDASTHEIADGKEYTDDLFIIDQHASDEKFNFETLQRDTKIRPQQLIRPRTLELSASEELVASDHIETLRDNGFEIQVDEDAPAGSRVRLISQPVSKDTVFGVKDLEELLHLLRDVHPTSPAASSVRCSKARAMFASRACRKSVMIGDALNARQMRSIVDHMGTIEQPWNCPHGRPTMRHLVSLDARMADVVLAATARGHAHRQMDWAVLASLQ